MEQRSYRLGEFLSLIEIERLIIDPPETRKEALLWVGVFEKLQDKEHECGEDLLQKSLIDCPQLFLLLAFCRSAASPKVVRSPEMTELLAEHKVLVDAFAGSECDFARGIRSVS